jgi:hypothetical protein
VTTGGIGAWLCPDEMIMIKDPFAKIASKKRKQAFGVTLGLREAAYRIPYIRKALETGDPTAVVLKEMGDD